MSTTKRKIATVSAGLLSVVAFFLMTTGTASAAPTPPFNQCPAVAHNTACAVLFTINPDGTITTSVDPTQGPYDAVEDSLVGVQNNTTLTTIPSLTLSGGNIFGLDGDGICSGMDGNGVPFTPPAGCPFDGTGYAGPNTTFTIVDANSGTVNFTGGLAPGASRYFSLEEPPSVTGSITVELPIIATGVNINATEGASFSGTVATFTDADAAAVAADYSATIDWGDGTATTTGTIGGTQATGFTVDGTHTYTEEGTYTLTVTITDIDTPANTDTVTPTASVADAALTAGTLTATGGVEGVTAATASFSFTDGNPSATSADFTSGGGGVVCDWGDGSTTSASVTGSGSGPYTATCGSHIYAEEGSNTVTVTVTDDGGSTTSAMATVTTADAPLHSACAAALVSPQAFSGKTATFTDEDPNGTLGDYTVSIDWGDSHTSAGTVTGPVAGTFTANGSHTYTTTGSFTIKTTITDHNATTTATCTTLIFAFAPGRGAFVIGNGNSATGTAVTFWGAQWWKLNTLSGGAAPAAFKGYALNPATPSCGINATWSTDPGNSAPPPAGPLPAFMGVIVTSSSTQSGSQISGNIVHIVVLQTNPGYDANPGHAGTGKVVALFC